MNQPAHILLVEDNRMDVELTLDAFHEAKLLNTIMLLPMDKKRWTIFLGAASIPTEKNTFPLPNLVLLDLKLPGIDGFEVLRQIKSTPFLKRLHIVILTSSKEEGDRALSYDGARTVTLSNRSHSMDFWVWCGRLKVLAVVNVGAAEGEPWNRLVRVLYVDDYPLDRELVRDALERDTAGFDLVEAASRGDFETALAQGGFDLVLSDSISSVLKGLQDLEAVGAKDPHLPVIIVTGTGSEEVAAEAIKRGAADYVIKRPKHINVCRTLSTRCRKETPGKPNDNMWKWLCAKVEQIQVRV
jgi:CheY-like chemotaxis protein